MIIIIIYTEIREFLSNNPKHCYDAIDSKAAIATTITKTMSHAHTK